MDAVSGSINGRPAELYDACLTRPDPLKSDITIPDSAAKGLTLPYTLLMPAATRQAVGTHCFPVLWCTVAHYH